MAELLDLPVELMQMVVLALPRSQDVAAVAATCKYLNHIASGELYQNIRLRLSDPTNSQELGAVVALGSCLFLNDPKLGLSIETLSITSPDAPTRYFPRLVPADINTVKNRLATLGSEEWPKIAEDHLVNIADGEAWAYMTMLMYSCPNIHTLSLDGNFFPMMDFWDAEMSPFEKIRTVDLVTSGFPNAPRSPPSTNVMRGLSKMKWLEKLRLTWAGDWFHPRLGRGDSALDGRPDRFICISHLMLWKCELKMDTIRRLLNYMLLLTTLEIDLLFSVDLSKQDYDLKWCLVDLKRLRKAISSVGLGFEKHLTCGALLEHLKITVDFAPQGFDFSANGIDCESQVLPEEEEDWNHWGEVDDEDDDNGNDEHESENEVRRYGAVYRVGGGDAPCNGPQPTQWEINAFGSLKNFANLKTLEIEPMLLYGNLRSATTQENNDTKPESRPSWTSLGELLPVSLREFHITTCPVSWFSTPGDADFSRTPGAGADLDFLIDMFTKYKEGRSRVWNLQKVIHKVQKPSSPDEHLRWNEKQMVLKNLLESLGIDYEIAA